MKPGDLNRLIARIYEAVDTPSAWFEIGNDIQRHLASPQGFFFLRHKKDLAVLDSHIWGWLQESFEDYERYFYSVDVWSQTMLRHAPGKFVASHEIVSEQKLKRSEFYNDFARQRAIRHGNGVYFAVPEHDAVAHFGCVRERGQFAYQGDEMRAFDLLVPHLQQFISLRQRLQRLKSDAHLGLNHLDNLQQPAVVCDAAGKVLAQNAAAERLWSYWQLHNDTGAFLTLRSNAANVCLLEALRSACAAAEGESAPPPVSLPLPHGREPLSVTVHPMRFTPSNSLLRADRSACLLLFETALPTDLTAGDLVRRYGLSRAEAEIAMQLADSQPPKVIAAKRDTSLLTVRTQIRAIYRKLGVNSQLGLAKALASARKD